MKNKKLLIIKKIVIICIVVLLLFNFIVPNKSYAATSSGLDTITGILVEPIVEIVTFLIDAVMSVLSSVMTGDNIEFVMQSTPINVSGEGTSFPITDIDSYKNILGNLNVNYPNFNYSPEEIFAGKIELLNANFISNSSSTGPIGNLRVVISSWYKALRIFALVGLLSILIYTGIKIIISSTASDKAKYKERIFNWFVALGLLFVLHYLMAFIVLLIQEISKLLGQTNGIINVTMSGGLEFTTNLIGLARFQMQQNQFSQKISYLVVYVALVVFTFKFTFLYLKRTLKVAFLTLIAPLVALMYPIDKMDGKAKGFELWLKEYIFNMLLQPIHYLLYFILVSSSLSLAANNPLYAIVCILFISSAERFLKKIFGFDKARGGTVGGIAGAYATGSLVGAMTKLLGKGSTSSKGKSSKSDSKSGSQDEDDEIPEDVIDDANIEDFLLENQDNYEGMEQIPEEERAYYINEENNEPQTETQSNMDIDNTMKDYRTQIAGLFGVNPQLDFGDGDSRSFEEILRQMMQGSGNSDELMDLLGNRISANEEPFLANNLPFGYIDGDTRSNEQIYNDLLNNFNGNKEKFNNDLKLLQQRMAQNDYINRNLLSNNLHTDVRVMENEGSKTSNARRVLAGVGALAKAGVKPVIDVDKSVKYNLKRFGGKALKGVVGASVGITAATVQAGISITDGKYNILEGVAAGAAGAVAGAHLVDKASKAKKALGDNDTIKKYSDRWYDRDDTVQNFKEEYGTEEKQMRKRAKESYVMRGIVDFEEQKKAIKFADQLVKEGRTQEDADRIAVATLQYKKTLIKEKTYGMLHDSKKMEKYLDSVTETHQGKASKLSVRKTHMDLIDNVIKFDKINN